MHSCTIASRIDHSYFIAKTSLLTATGINRLDITGLVAFATGRYTVHTGIDLAVGTVSNESVDLASEGTPGGAVIMFSPIVISGCVKNPC